MSQPLSTLNALSPLDGRYAGKVDALRPWLSEAAFMRQRVFVEIHWLLALASADLPDIPKINAADEAFLTYLKSMPQMKLSYYHCLTVFLMPMLSVLKRSKSLPIMTSKRLSTS
ncbi:MAG: hypothetical protein RLZZ406_654 [Pseudomonadota bacterium]